MLPAKVSSYEFHVATLPCKVTSSRIVTLYCGSMTCLVLSGPGIFFYYEIRKNPVLIELS